MFRLCISLYCVVVLIFLVISVVLLWVVVNLIRGVVSSGLKVCMFSLMKVVRGS